MPMNARLLRPIASGVHPEAAAWRSAVVANGGSVSASTMRAVSKFCADIDRAGIRDRFYRLNLFAGTGLNAALVPLYRGPTYSPDGLGPELWSLSTPTIVNSDGSNGAWDGATSSFSNTVTGTGSSVPRFRFSLPITAGKSYRVSGVLTGDTAAMASVSIRLASSGFTVIPYNSTTGVFSGSMVAATTFLEFLMDSTQGAKSVTIASVSVREVLTYGNTTDTNNGPFVSGDYSLTSGLTGNGSSKYLNTGYPANTLAASNSHLSLGVLATDTVATSDRTGMGAWNGGANVLELRLRDRNGFVPLASTFTRYGTAGDRFGDSVASASLTAGNITSAWPTMYRNGTASGTVATSSQDFPTAANVFVLALNNNGIGVTNISNARIGYYSIGATMTSGQADAYSDAIDAFYAAIGRS